MSVVDLNDTSNANSRDQYALTGPHPSDCSLCHEPLHRISVYWFGEKSWPIPQRPYPLIQGWRPEDILLHPYCAAELAHRAAKYGRTRPWTITRMSADAYIAMSLANGYPVLRGVAPSLSTMQAIDGNLGPQPDPVSETHERMLDRLDLSADTACRGVTVPSRP